MKDMESALIIFPSKISYDIPVFYLVNLLFRALNNYRVSLTVLLELQYNI